jgi:hypothetical protein
MHFYTRLFYIFFIQHLIVLEGKPGQVFQKDGPKNKSNLSMANEPPL